MERAIFKATNAKGVTYDLMDFQSGALFAQEGLGYDENTNYSRIGNFWIPDEVILAQPEITGVIMFVGSDSYQKYFDFVRWSRHTPITIEQQTDAGTFYIDTVVKSVDKSEARHNSAGMTCTVVFRGLGLYYGHRSAVLQQDDSGGSDVYPYEYDLTYGAETVNYVRIPFELSVEAPLALTIYGRIRNPSWLHYVNGELYASGAYNGTIEAGRKLVIDNRAIPFQITERNLANGFIADRYQQCDFSTERFLYLQEGQNVIVVEHDDSNTLQFRIDARVEYESI
jgi:hypothetical protein